MNITNSTPYGSGSNKELIGVDFSATPKTPFRFKTFNIAPYYNVKDFGAKGDGVTDDTSAIQSAISYILNNSGGRLFVPNGIYIIAGACQTVSSTGGTASNAQLTIPGIVYSDIGRSSIEIIGESPPNMLPASGGWANFGNFLQTGGVTFKSTLTSNSTGYILGAETKSGGAYVFTYHDVYIENIAFQSGSDANGAIVGGVNGTQMHALSMKNCCGFANTNVYTSVLPTREISGINIGPVNCDWPNSLFNCVVIGYKHGIIAAEHVNIDHCFVYGCLNGFSIDNGAYTVRMGQVGAFWCKNIVNCKTTFHGLLIADIVECEKDFLGKWYSYQYFINDPSNLLHGKLTYHIATSNVGWDNASFTKNGGTNLVCTPSY